MYFKDMIRPATADKCGCINYQSFMLALCTHGYFGSGVPDPHMARRQMEQKPAKSIRYDSLCQTAGNRVV